jgi:TusA-related sulfurtransferase
MESHACPYPATRARQKISHQLHHTGNIVFVSFLEIKINDPGKLIRVPNIVKYYTHCLHADQNMMKARIFTRQNPI